MLSLDNKDGDEFLRVNLDEKKLIKLLADIDELLTVVRADIDKVRTNDENGVYNGAVSLFQSLPLLYQRITEALYCLMFSEGNFGLINRVKESVVKFKRSAKGDEWYLLNPIKAHIVILQDLLDPIMDAIEQSEGDIQEFFANEELVRNLPSTVLTLLTFNRYFMVIANVDKQAISQQ